MKVDPEETAILVIYDYDLTLSKLHTQGAEWQHDFETPYIANLRMPRCLKSQLNRFKNNDNPKIILGIATFGENRRRIIHSCEALEQDKDSIMICAEYVSRRKAKKQGKNLHIVNLILQHYAKNPHVRLTHVVIGDDDPINIAALKDYQHFVTTTPPWNADERLNIPVHGVLAPQPVLLSRVDMPERGFPSRVLDLRYDQAAGKEVCCETPESELSFLEFLNSMEREITLIKSSELPNYYSAHNRHLHFARPHCRPLNPLTLSLDETMLSQLELGDVELDPQLVSNNSTALRRIASGSDMMQLDDVFLDNERNKLIKSH